MSSAISKAAFLDRDGVINHDCGYVYKIEDFSFVDGVFDACRRLYELDYKLIIATNQSGIARGYYTEEDFKLLNSWMMEQFAEHDAPIAAVYYCPFHSEHGVGRYRCESPYRKPGPQMLLDAAAEHGIDLSSSFLVGDKLSDLQAARAAGIERKYLIRNSKKGLTEEYECSGVFESLHDLVGLEFGL